MNELVKKYGLATLKIILSKGNKVRYNQILKDFPATSGTLSRVLKVLEQEGLIERTVDVKARPPVSYYSVTKEGVQLIKKDIYETVMALIEVKPTYAKEILEEYKEMIKKKKVKFSCVVG